MRVIVTSQTDIAGTNVYNDLAQNFGFAKEGDFEGKPRFRKGDVLLIATERTQVSANHLDEYFDAEYYVFASRHKSASREKTLTVHAPGNLTEEAKVGGRPKELAFCNADAMKAALVELKKARDELGLKYKVSMEVTHHGPSELEKPVTFVEVGSGEEEWNDKNAVRAVARATLKAAENEKVFEKAIGVGGGHYAPRHTMLALTSDVAIGHIIPNYAIDALEEDIFLEAVEKMKADFAFLDWKGMSKDQRKKMLLFAKDCKLTVKRGRDFRRPRTGYESKGLREFAIDEALFKEAEKVGGKELRELILKEGGIPLQNEHGRLINRFSSTRDLRREVIEKCLEILSDNFDIKVIGAKLVIAERRFDPEAAKKLGIEPGPLFGKLRRGMEINVDGRTIRPDEVVKMEERILDIKDEFTMGIMEKENI